MAYDAILTVEEKGADYEFAAMAPGALSLADLLLAPHLSMFALAPEGVAILQDHKNLNGWLARIEVRPNMKATTWDKLLERVADPFRLRVPFAPDDGEIVRYDAAEVEWRPISAPDVGLIELPQPGPVLAALVSVTVQVEKNCLRCAAPDFLQLAPVEAGIGLEKFVHAFQDARSIRLRA